MLAAQKRISVLFVLRHERGDLGGCDCHHYARAGTSSAALRRTTGVVMGPPDVLHLGGTCLFRTTTSRLLTHSGQLSTTLLSSPEPHHYERCSRTGSFLLMQSGGSWDSARPLQMGGCGWDGSRWMGASLAGSPCAALFPMSNPHEMLLAFLCCVIVQLM